MKKSPSSLRQKTTSSSHGQADVASLQTKVKGFAQMVPQQADEFGVSLE